MVKDDLNLPDFKLVNITYGKTVENYTAGLWHRLYVSIYFHRLFGFYILQVTSKLAKIFHISYILADVFANIYFRLHQVTIIIPQIHFPLILSFLKLDCFLDGHKGIAS